MSIEVTNKVKVYSDSDYIEPQVENIEVCGHWNRDSMVILKVGTYTVQVSAKDLEAAVRNATNINRYG